LSKSDDIFLEVAHIGSTSIPGAPAKDIVDIQCAINSFDKMEQMIKDSVIDLLSLQFFKHYEFDNNIHNECNIL